MRRDDGIPEEVLPVIFGQGVEIGGNYQPVPGATLHTSELEAEKRAEAATLFVRKATEEYMNGCRSFTDMPVMHYALWNLLDWRRPHNEPETAVRFRSKLIEELKETLEEFAKAPEPSAEKSGVEEQELVSELGDLLYCATAAANMLGANIEKAVAEEILDVYGEAKRHPTIGEIDKKVASGIGRRDRLYPNGQYPYFVWNLYNHEELPTLDLMPNQVLIMLAGFLYTSLGPIAESEFRVEGPGSKDVASVERLIAKLWLFTAFYAQLWANSSLEAVVAKNMRKISGRVEQGTIEDRSARTTTTL